MKDRRVRKINNIVSNKGESIVYVVSRDIRIGDNFALAYAANLSAQEELPLIVLFNLYPKVKNRIAQQYEFLLGGLREFQEHLDKKGVQFIVGTSTPLDNLKRIEDQLKPKAFVFDFSPLRGSKKLKENFGKISSAEIFEVDTHNVIPVWETSDKEEFAAYTIRPKIYKKIKEYLEEEISLKIIPKEIKIDLDSTFFINPNAEDWSEIRKKIKANTVEGYTIKFNPGESEAIKVLENFIDAKLEFYGSRRNDPNQDFQSNLSPYLHYGFISSRTAVNVVMKSVKDREGVEINFEENRNRAGVAEETKSGLKQGAEAFIEEIVVRKELCENFCFYNNNYDNIKGLKEWAIKSLNKHKEDKREFIYSKDQFERAETHDPAWNAAQRQLKSEGKMHGYMRMYWAKKILEWSHSAEDAIKIAVYLNDKYHIDGYDPNGYVGILWSIGGLHDRAWFEREVFGQIRYMNSNGLKKKFDLGLYIKRYQA